MEEEDAHNNGGTELARILPHDVMLEILCRLPVKSLVKFSCVKKSWYNLVNNDPFFVERHFDRYSKAQNDTFIGSVNYYMLYVGTDLWVIRLGSGECEELRLRERNIFYDIVGSSKGLICLTNLHPRSGVYEFKVINPALREHRRVIKQARYKRHVGVMHTCVGFGFDKKNRDFKILRVEYIVEESEQWFTRVHLYSLNSDSWKVIPNPKNIIFDSRIRYMVTIGSCLYCFSYLQTNRGDVITGFDLTTETFHTISPPESKNLDCICLQIVAWENESLAVILGNIHGDYEMWTLSDPCNKQCSWKMKTPFSLDHAIELPARAKSFFGLVDLEIPIFFGHSEYNSYSFVYMFKKFWSGKPDEVAYDMFHNRISCYRESLVPLFRRPRVIHHRQTFVALGKRIFEEMRTTFRDRLHRIFM